MVHLFDFNRWRNLSQRSIKFFCRNKYIFFEEMIHKYITPRYVLDLKEYINYLKFLKNNQRIYCEEENLRCYASLNEGRLTSLQYISKTENIFLFGLYYNLSKK